jgi:hypothetical protein
MKRQEEAVAYAPDVLEPPPPSNVVEVHGLTFDLNDVDDLDVFRDCVEIETDFEIVDEEGEVLQ